MCKEQSGNSIKVSALWSLVKVTEGQQIDPLRTG